jgi:mannose-P-dolichol utilization defect protein 1
VFLFAQNAILLALVYLFTGARARGAVAAAVAALWLRFLLSPALTPALARRLMDGSTAIFLAARLPQIAANARAKSTGNLSIVTYAANTLGSLARVFTSVSAGGGGALVRNYALGAALNATVVGQILAYGKGGAAGKKKGAGAKGKGAGAGRRSTRAKAA